MDAALTLISLGLCGAMRAEAIRKTPAILLPTACAFANYGAPKVPN